MSGLLGFMAAGAAKGYADGRGREIAQEKEFDLKLALMDAQMDKELRLKEAGFAMEDKRAAAEMERNKSYMADVEETRKTPESVINKYTDEKGQEQVVKSGGDVVKTTREATMQDGFERAMKGGDFKSAETFAKMAPKGKDFESIKLEDGSVMAFDKSNGTAKIVLEGGHKVDVPKSELELAWRMAGGDAEKAANILVSQKAKVSAAGRAPQRETETESRKRDFIDAYSDNAEYVKNGKLTAKGFDKFNKIENDEYQTVTEAPVIDLAGNIKLDKNGKPLMTTKVTRKEKVPEKPNGALSRDKNGNYIFSR